MIDAKDRPTALAAPDTTTLRERPRWIGGAIGFVTLIAIWYLLAVTFLAHKHVLPRPDVVIKTVFYDPGYSVWPALGRTATEAGFGFLWGNAIALFLAGLFVVFPIAERALLRVALATYCMPVIAIGPILQIILNGTAPKIALAALSVLFTTLIGALRGLRSADPISIELIGAYGGRRWQEFWRVRFHAALPSTFAGLSIAAPAAVLGAIIGEYLGTDQGIGLGIMNAENVLNAARVWALALIVTALAGAGYFVIHTVGRALTPWAPRQAST
ncbi:MAG TPA: ABC transporter permease subunit [Acidimicrobiales bacterium]|nr:ABC transporter permease subunit [Acidimicrobiales bacterium]